VSTEQEPFISGREAQICISNINLQALEIAVGGMGPSNLAKYQMRHILKIASYSNLMHISLDLFFTDQLDWTCLAKSIKNSPLQESLISMKLYDVSLTNDSVKFINTVASRFTKLKIFKLSFTIDDKESICMLQPMVFDKHIEELDILVFEDILDGESDYNIAQRRFMRNYISSAYTTASQTLKILDLRNKDNHIVYVNDLFLNNLDRFQEVETVSLDSDSFHIGLTDNSLLSLCKLSKLKKLKFSYSLFRDEDAGRLEGSSHTLLRILLEQQRLQTIILSGATQMLYTILTTIDKILLSITSLEIGVIITEPPDVIIQACHSCARYFPSLTNVSITGSYYDTKIVSAKRLEAIFNTKPQHITKIDIYK
jgi:hypothetical protein